MRPLNVRPIHYWRMTDVQKERARAEWVKLVANATLGIPKIPAKKHPAALAAPIEECTTCEGTSWSGEEYDESSSDESLNAAYFPDAMEALGELYNVAPAESVSDRDIPNLQTQYYTNRHRNKIPNLVFCHSMHVLLAPSARKRSLPNQRPKRPLPKNGSD